MDGSMNQAGDRYELAFERRLAHSPQKVWRVVTEKELLNQWFPAHVIGEWKVGAALRFEFQHGEGDGLPDEDLRGEVLTVEPERLLEFRWGTHVIRCEIVPDGEGCKLLFSADFDNPAWGARDAAGWEFCLKNFDAVLQDAATGEFVLSEWRGLFEQYVAAFEPKFGPQEDPPEAAIADRESEC